MSSFDDRVRSGFDRRTLFRGAAALGAVGALSSVAACGGGSSGGGTSGTIRYISDENDPVTEKIQKKMFADFEKKHPKIKINAEFLTFDKAASRIQQLVGAGSPPDLVKRDADQLARFQAVNLLAPVTNTVKQIGGVSSAVRLIVDGQDYVIPTDLGIPLLFYRKDMLDKAGVKPPETWDDFKAAMDPLKKSLPKSVYPNLMVTNAAGGYTGEFFIENAWSNDVRLWDWKSGKWTVALDQPANTKKTEEVLDFYKFRKKYSPEAGNYVYADVNQSFGSGKIAIIQYSGARTLVYLRAQAPDIASKTGTAPTVYNTQPRQPLSVGGLAVFKNKNGVDRKVVQELALSMVTGPLYLDYLWTVPGHLIPPSKSLFKGKWRDHKYIGDDTELMSALDSRYNDCYPVTTGPPVSGVSPSKPNLAGGDANVSNVYAELVGAAVGAGQDEKAAITATVGKMAKLEKNP